jgi:DNA repair protein RadC
MKQKSPPLKPVGKKNNHSAGTCQNDPKKTPASKRYARYKSVIECAVAQAEFELSEVKEACLPELPGFITRIVHDLEKNGWVVRESKSSKSFRWNQAREFSINRWLDEKLFGTQIKESPEQERPREKLLARGVEHLTNSELIAILVRSGRPGESAVMAGQKVAKAFDGRLEDLPAAGRAELKEISGAVEKTAYCQIMAGVELGRRVAALSDDKITVKISSSSDAIEFCQKFFSRLVSDAKQEEFHIVTLDTKNQVIDTHQITVGTLDASLVHPREVFRAAIKDAASSVILVHNHPSGDPTPSREDIAVTRRLTESGKLIGIDVLDHIVLGRPTSVSIQETM